MKISLVVIINIETVWGRICWREFQHHDKLKKSPSPQSGQNNHINRHRHL